MAQGSLQFPALNLLVWLETDHLFNNPCHAILVEYEIFKKLKTPAFGEVLGVF